jgi:hypothetical protein
MTILHNNEMKTSGIAGAHMQERLVCSVPVPVDFSVCCLAAAAWFQSFAARSVVVLERT